MGKLFEEDKAVREFVEALLSMRTLTDKERERYLAIEQTVSEKSLSYHNLKQNSDEAPDLGIEKGKMQIAKTAIERYAGELEGATDLILEADKQIELRTEKPLFKERVFNALVSLKHSFRNLGNSIWRKFIIQEGNFVDLKRLLHEKGKDPSQELGLLKKDVTVPYIISVGLTALASPFLYVGLTADKQPIGLVIAAVAALFMGFSIFGGYSNWRLIRNTKNKYHEIIGGEQIEALH